MAGNAGCNWARRARAELAGALGTRLGARAGADGRWALGVQGVGWADAGRAGGAQSGQTGMRGRAGVRSGQLSGQAWGAVGAQACGAARQGAQAAGR